MTTNNLMVDPREELLALLKENLGEWFSVSYDLKQNEDGSFDIRNVQAEKRNG